MLIDDSLIILDHEKSAESTAALDPRKLNVQFKILFDLMPDPAVIIDQNYTFIALNKCALEVTGTKENELVGKKFLEADFLTQESKIVLSKNFSQRMNGVKTSLYEARSLTKDGTERIWEVNASVIDSNGERCDLVIFREITDRKHAETALLKSKMLLETVLASMNDALITFNAEGQILDFNDAYMKLYKFKNRNEVPKNIRDCTEFVEASLLDGSPVAMEDFASVRALKGEKGLQEYKITRKCTGESWFANYSYAPLRGVKGEIIGAVMAIRDITERQKMEMMLKEKTSQLFEKEQRLQNIIESSPNAILVTGLDSTVRECNQATLDLTGFKNKEELIGRRVTDLLQSTTGSTNNFIKKIIDDGKIENIPSVLVNRNHEEIPIEITAGLIIEPTGRPESFVAVVNNVAEKKRLIEELQSNKERYRMLFADAPIALWEVEFSGVMKYLRELQASGVKDYKAYFGEHPERIAQLRTMMKIIEVNKATETLFGVSSAEVDTFFSKGDLASESLVKISDGIFEFAQGRRFYETEGILKTPGGVKNISIQAFLSSTQSNECAVIVSIVDITERYRLMEMKEQFVTHITHELRTPLVSITGYLDYILKGSLGEVPEKIGQKLQIVRKNALRLSALTNDLLDARRIEAGKFVLFIEPVPIMQVLEDCLKEIEPSVRAKQQTLRANLPNMHLLIEADRVRLTQIIMNILSNASKYTPNNGEIVISTEETGEGVIVRISDTGTGIRKEDLMKIFEPFANVKKSINARGTGLGLYVTKGLVEAHGGKLWVESQGENKGSTFIFSIPKKGENKIMVNGVING